MRTLMSLAGIAVFVLMAVLAMGLGGPGGRGAGALLVAEGLASPVGLGLDNRGGLYVAEGEGGRVMHVLSGGKPTVLAEGLGSLGGLAVGHGAEVYVSCPLKGEVVRIDGRGERTVFARGLDEPRGLHVDGRGRLLVTEAGSGRVLRLGPDCEREVVFAGMALPISVAASKDLVLASGCGGVRAAGSPGWPRCMPVDAEADAGPHAGSQCPAGAEDCCYLLASGPGGQVWALDREQGCVLRVAGGVGGGFRLPEGIGFVSGLTCDRDGNLMAATQDGRIWLLRPAERSTGRAAVALGGAAPTSAQAEGGERKRLGDG